MPNINASFDPILEKLLMNTQAVDIFIYWIFNDDNDNNDHNNHHQKICSITFQVFSGHSIFECYGNVYSGKSFPEKKLSKKVFRKIQLVFCFLLINIFFFQTTLCYWFFCLVFVPPPPTILSIINRYLPLFFFLFKEFWFSLIVDHF